MNPFTVAVPYPLRQILRFLTLYSRGISVPLFAGSSA